MLLIFYIKRKLGVGGTHITYVMSFVAVPANLGSKTVANLLAVSRHGEATLGWQLHGAVGVDVVDAEPRRVLVGAEAVKVGVRQRRAAARRRVRRRVRRRRRRRWHFMNSSLLMLHTARAGAGATASSAAATATTRTASATAFAIAVGCWRGEELDRAS